MRSLEKKPVINNTSLVDYDFMRLSHTLIWQLICKWCDDQGFNDEDVILTITPYFVPMEKRVAWCVSVYTTDFNDIVYTGQCPTHEAAMYKGVCELAKMVGIPLGFEDYQNMAYNLGLI